MIIQINATVCAALDHGEGRQLKIAGSDQVTRGKEGQVTRRNKKWSDVANWRFFRPIAVSRGHEIESAPSARGYFH